MGTVCNARLHLWIVVWAVVEVAVCVGGVPIHTGGQFGSILFYMDVKERNWSFGLLLHHELDFYTLTVRMLEETLQLPVTMFPDDKGVIHVA